MKPIESLNWIKGLRAGYQSINAVQKEQYSWLARTQDGYVLTAEIDHIDPARNQFDYKNGTFHKQVPALSVDSGDHPGRIRHAQELLDSVKLAHSEKIGCRLMLLRGTKYGTTKDGIRSAIDNGYWSVTEVTGDVESGFEFRLIRN